MNKYSLTFRDTLIEKEYQNILCSTERKLTLVLVSLGFGSNYGLRVLLCFIQNDYTLFYFKLGLFLHIVIQYLIVRVKTNYIRHAFVLINLSNLLINFQTDSNVTLEIQNLKGANSMAASFLVLLSGEFTEAMFIFTLQTIYRITIVFALGDTMNYATIITSVLLNFYCSFYFYQYHKARRSQYLLGRIQTDWGIILTELIDVPYVLLKFNYEELNFKVQKVQQFPFYRNTNKLDNDILAFMNQSKYENKTLSSIIFSCIKSYQQKPQDFFNKRISINYNHQLIEINISVCHSSSPLILLKLKIKESSFFLSAIKLNQQKYLSLTNIFINLIKQLCKKYKQKQLKIIQRKLICIKLLHTIRGHQKKFSVISVEKIIKVLQSFFPELLFINMTTNGQLIKTRKNILVLFLFQIFESNTERVVKCQIIETGISLIFEIEGNFDTKRLQKVKKILGYQLRLIFEQCVIETKNIQLIMRNEPMDSFQGLVRPRQSFENNSNSNEIVSLTDDHTLLNKIN